MDSSLWSSTYLADLVKRFGLAKAIPDYSKPGTSFLTSDWRVAQGLQGTTNARRKGKITNAGAARKASGKTLSLAEVGGEFNDTQRQLASAEYAVQTGRVPNEVAAHSALVGSLEPQTVPYVPRAVIQKQGHREKDCG